MTLLRPSAGRLASAGPSAFPSAAGGRGAAEVRRRGASALGDAKSPLLPVPLGIGGRGFRLAPCGRSRPRTHRAVLAAQTASSPFNIKHARKCYWPKHLDSSQRLPLPRLCIIRVKGLMLSSSFRNWPVFQPFRDSYSTLPPLTRIIHTPLAACPAYQKGPEMAVWARSGRGMNNPG